MQVLINFIKTKSVRKQYLLFAIFMAIVVLTYTWYSGIWVGRTGKASVNQIEKRIKVAELTHRIRRATINADNALNLFLLSPTEKSRHQFDNELKQAHDQLIELVQTDWAHNGKIQPMLNGLTTVLKHIDTAAAQIMKVRQDANLMYPAMRLANGDMLIVNRDFISQADSAIDFYSKKKTLKEHQKQIYILLIDMRDKWHRMINSYRLFIINRTGSLFENATQNQINDVKFF